MQDIQTIRQLVSVLYRRAAMLNLYLASPSACQSARIQRELDSLRLMIDEIHVRMEQD